MSTPSRTVARRPATNVARRATAYVPTENDRLGHTPWQRVWTLRPVRFVRARAALLCVLVVQVTLTVPLTNTAFQDEALYLYAGHRQLGAWLHGTPTYDNYATYFSGAPFLHPVLAALVDDLGGVAAARALSLVFAVATTTLLFLTARRLFDRAVALIAAIVFAVSEPTLFNGHLATYDAAALFLLALAAWIGVTTARLPAPMILLATPVVVAAGFTKYAAVLYIPSTVAVCVLAAARERGWRPAATRALLLTTSVIAAAAVILHAAPQLWEGIRTTTTDRRPGQDPAWAVIHASANYIGLPLLIAIAGVVVYSRRDHGFEHDRSPRYLRAALAIVLTGTALVAPISHIHLHTLTSLHKHVGFGLWFAAPMAGAALAHLIHAHTFRSLATALAACAAIAWLGTGQAAARFHDWPHTDQLVAVLRTQIRPVTGHYLVEENEVPRYYLRDLTQPYQWVGTFYFEYTDKKGNKLAGIPAYQAAIADRYFDVIALRYGPTASLDRQIDRQLDTQHGYELVATLAANSSFGDGNWHVWRRK